MAKPCSPSLGGAYTSTGCRELWQRPVSMPTYTPHIVLTEYARSQSQCATSQGSATYLLEVGPASLLDLAADGSAAQLRDEVIVSHQAPRVPVEGVQRLLGSVHGLGSCIQP